jgi:ribosome modulation factor
MPRKKTTDPAPGIGNNSAGVTAEVFNRHLALIETAEAACEIANKKRSTLRKSARAAGIRLTEFDAMRKIAGLPRLEQIEKLTSARDYLIYLRSPLGAQMKMEFDAIDPFNEDDAAAKTRIAADAEAEGYRAGLAGVLWEDNNPHSPDLPEGQCWIKGWREGQTNRAEALGDEVDTGA